MKFRKTGQVLLAVAATAAVGLGTISCGQSHTIDYVYVTSNKNSPGEINAFRVDSQSGALTQITGSPFASGGNNPVAEVTSPDSQYLFVANRDDGSVVRFQIGSDGTLAKQNACTTPGSSPSSMTFSSDGTLLFVVDFYQSGFSDTNPGPGDLVVYNVNSDGSLGTAAGNCTPVTNTATGQPYWALGRYPGTVATTPLTFVSASTPGANSTLYPYVFVTATNTYVTTTTPPTTGAPPAPSGLQGQIYGFSIAKGGVLSSVAGSPFTAGATPTGLALDPTGRFLYTTDSQQDQLIGYTISTKGVLTAINSGPVATGTFPVAVTVDPTGFYAYLVNYTSGTVSEYAIDQATGAPTAGASSAAKADAGASSIVIDPGLARVVLTANFTGADITSMTLNPNTGALSENPNSPYPTGGQPTAVIAVPHGNHATTHVQSGAGD
ncbi:lactonase family protein [Paracidobacterium acidisoli]|nr:beta-propeller fold lactonase family protein [Paracidobacterium acidisoli]MBT9331336.1 lactonase family protein [Paracidobacterium acidisoli]